MGKNIRRSVDLIEKIMGQNSEVYKQGVAIDSGNQYVADIDVHYLNNDMREYHVSIYPFNDNKRLDSINLMKVHESDDIDEQTLIDKAKYRFNEWLDDEGK